MKMKNSLSKNRLKIEDILKDDSPDKSKIFFINQQNSHQKIDQFKILNSEEK